MAWVLLPVNYTDAVWVGLKRYNQIDNEDGTISLQDVTVYSNKEKSFFGAKDANRMNEALNTIMSMVENGTDLYAAFQNYFAEQKALFTTETKSTQKSFEDYIDNLKTSSDKSQAEFVYYTEQLKAQGDLILDVIKLDYREDINNFENEQEEEFNQWFDSVRDILDAEAAGKLLVQLQEIQAQQPTKLIATIPDVAMLPIKPTLWATSYQFGIESFGTGAFGGGDEESLPLKIQHKTDGSLLVYTIPKYGDNASVSNVGGGAYAINFEGETGSLYLQT